MKEQCEKCKEWVDEGCCYDNGLCFSCDQQAANDAATRQQERNKFGAGDPDAYDKMRDARMEGTRDHECIYDNGLCHACYQQDVDDKMREAGGGR